MKKAPNSLDDFCSRVQPQPIDRCVEHGTAEPCHDCLEREEAAAFWHAGKRRDRERLDEYCEVYEPGNAELFDSQDDETENDE